LSYITLGQNATTLSGGEAQRVNSPNNWQNATQQHPVYFYEPPLAYIFTTSNNCCLFTHLRDHGNTIIVIEHNLD